jgi:starch-binding outer membrane protein, SusD/RagB family
MKNIKYFIIAILFFGIGSCEYLDYNEEDFFTEEEEVFADFSRIKSYLSGIYNMLPDGFNNVGGAMRESASDNAVEASSLASIHYFNDGNWSANNTLDDKWDYYSGIREANRYINNIDTTVIEDRKYNDDYIDMLQQMRTYKDEARFLRAYFYFELMKRYGSVPLITEILSAEQANTVEMASRDAIVQFIVDECNAIIPNLWEDFENVVNKEKGRATKGAARALKARTLLYAASPLYNTGGQTTKWEAAAEAAAEIINSNNYVLESDYAKVVNNFTSKELILGRRYAPSNDFERANYPLSYSGEPGTCPSQNLVDTYRMTDGLKYNESPLYDPDNPYQDRDPRLAKTILYNGSAWKGETVETYQGGKDGPPLVLATPTGYYLKKYVLEALTIVPPSPTTSEHLWVFFRYGEVLLNYAEAMNEAYGPNVDPEGYGMTALDAVNMIRSRAGIADLPAGISQSEFREEVRDERRVELAFEDHRFWDVRRWEIGSQTTDIKGMKITRNADESFDYQKITVQTRPWEDKYYLYPIPQEEIFINGNLAQNPGW